MQSMPSASLRLALLALPLVVVLGCGPRYGDASALYADAARNDPRTAIYKAEFFALKPGLAPLSGLLLTLPLSAGPIRIGHVVFNLYWMLLGVASLAGLTTFFFGCLAQIFCDYTGEARRKWRRIFDYTAAAMASIVVFLIGLGLCLALFVVYAERNFTLPNPTSAIDHLGVIGILLASLGFLTFCFTLPAQATAVRYGRRDDASGEYE